MDREESCWLRERPRGGTRTRDGVGKHGLSFLQGFLGACLPSSGYVAWPWNG